MPTLPPPYVEGHRLLEGRTVVITAAAGTGIGSAVARRCIEEGATILVSDAHERRLAEAVEELSELAGAPVASAACNVTVQDDIDGLFAAAVDQLGHIDVLINNAGLGGTADLIEMTDEQWSLVLDVTLTGTFRATRAALQHMVPRGKGVIVNNASVLGWRAQAGQAHYAAAKAGVMALTRCAAIEAAPAGHPHQRGGAEPGHAPVPGQGDLRRAARRADRPGRPSAGPPSRGRWPTPWCSWPATTPRTSPARSSR